MLAVSFVYYKLSSSGLIIISSNDENSDFKLIFYRGSDTAVLTRVLPLIRFPHMSTQTLLDIPRIFPRVGFCESFKTLLQEALTFKVN